MKTYPTLEEVEILDHYQLKLKYKNGENGENRIYDFSPNFEHPFYTPLKDKHSFSQVKVVDGGLLWQTGQDFCPYTLYDLSIKID